MWLNHYVHDTIYITCQTKPVTHNYYYKATAGCLQIWVTHSLWQPQKSQPWISNHIRCEEKAPNATDTLQVFFLIYIVIFMLHLLVSLEPCLRNLCQNANISLNTIYLKIAAYHEPVMSHHLNSSPPGQNIHYFADDIFRCIFVNGKFCILIKISLKFVPKGPNDNISALV